MNIRTSFRWGKFEIIFNLISTQLHNPPVRRLHPLSLLVSSHRCLINNVRVLHITSPTSLNCPAHVTSHLKIIKTWKHQIISYFRFQHSLTPHLPQLLPLPLPHCFINSSFTFFLLKLDASSLLYCQGCNFENESLFEMNWLDVPDWLTCTWLEMFCGPIFVLAADTVQYYSKLSGQVVCAAPHWQLIWLGLNLLQCSLNNI